MDNRAVINGEASVERNTSRLSRLRAALEKPGISDERKASLQDEIDRIGAHLKQQRDALNAALG